MDFLAPLRLPTLRSGSTLRFDLREIFFTPELHGVSRNDHGVLALHSLRLSVKFFPADPSAAEALAKSFAD